MKFNQAICVIAATLALAGAHASTVAVLPGGDLGTNPDHQSFSGASGGAVNTYTFTLDAEGFTGAWDLSGYFTGIFLPVDVSLISVTGVNGTQTYTPISFTDNQFSFTGLLDGEYTLSVTTEQNPGANGVLYGELTATMATSPVPEPASVALLLAGVGVAGLLSRRRRAS